MTMPACRHRVAALAVLLLAATAAAQDHGQGLDHDHEAAAGSAAGDHAEEIVVLAPAVAREFGVATRPAGPADIARTVSLPGEVQPDADRLAHITPRFEGIVTETRADLGDRVREGQTLAVIEGDESLAPYELKTLVAGTVIGKHLVLGEAVGRDRTAYVVADLSRVWVDLAVFQRDLARVGVGQSVALRVGHEDTAAVGTISYVTPTVDEHTRTATARVVLPNPDGRWRPGMFLGAEVTVERHAAAVAVPPSALQTVFDETVVFVREDHGFVARPVRTGRHDREQVEILAGVAAGEPVVVTGSFVLKSELEKAAFGDGHGHAH